jgi:type I restriction enzyme S subunit
MQTSFNNFTKQISAKEMKNLYFSDKGLIRLLSTGNFDKCTDEIKTFYIGEVLTIPGGGGVNGFKNIKYHNGNFINSGNLLATSLDASKYSLKYLWY